MSAWSAAVIVAVVAVMTYSMRSAVIVALAGRTIPSPVQRALRSVGPAVLAALAINLATGGDGGPHLEVAEAAALLIAGGVAWWRKNVLWTLIAGMASLWILTALV